MYPDLQARADSRLLALLVLFAGVAGGLAAVILAIYLYKFCHPVKEERRKERHHPLPSQRQLELRRQSLVLMPFEGAEPIFKYFSPTVRGIVKTAKEPKDTKDMDEEADKSKSILFDLALDTKRIAQVFPLMKACAKECAGDAKTPDENKVTAVVGASEAQSRQAHRNEHVEGGEIESSTRGKKGSLKLLAVPKYNLRSNRAMSADVVVGEKGGGDMAVSAADEDESRRASFGTFMEDRCGTYRKATNVAERSWPVPSGGRRKLPSTERLELHDQVQTSTEGCEWASSQTGTKLRERFSSNASAAVRAHHNASYQPRLTPMIVTEGAGEMRTETIVRLNPLGGGRRASFLPRSEAVIRDGAWPPRKQASSPLPQRSQQMYDKGHLLSKSWNISGERTRQLHRQPQALYTDFLSPTSPPFANNYMPAVRPAAQQWQISRPLVATHSVYPLHDSHTNVLRPRSFTTTTPFLRPTAVTQMPRFTPRSPVLSGNDGQYLKRQLTEANRYDTIQPPSGVRLRQALSIVEPAVTQQDYCNYPNEMSFAYGFQQPNSTTTSAKQYRQRQWSTQREPKTPLLPSRIEDTTTTDEPASTSFSFDSSITSLCTSYRTEENSPAGTEEAENLPRTTQPSNSMARRLVAGEKRAVFRGSKPLSSRLDGYSSISSVTDDSEEAQPSKHVTLMNAGDRWAPTDRGDRYNYHRGREEQALSVQSSVQFQNRQAPSFATVERISPNQLRFPDVNNLQPSGARCRPTNPALFLQTRNNNREWRTFEAGTSIQHSSGGYARNTSLVRQFSRNDPYFVSIG